MSYKQGTATAAATEPLSHTRSQRSLFQISSSLRHLRIAFRILPLDLPLDFDNVHAINESRFELFLFREYGKNAR